MLMRRDAYTKVGGYRIFFENSQDKDLWMRMSQFYRLGIVNECHYQRSIFLADGIASSFSKTLQQVAYSRVADLCHQERLRNKLDSAEQYGPLALMRVSKGWRTTWRLVRAVRQIKRFDTFDHLEDLHHIKLFGLLNFLLISMLVFTSNIISSRFK